MGVIVVQRYAPSGGGVVADVGTQDVSGQTLTFNGPVTLYFDTSVFTAPGTYTIFTYGTLVGDPVANGWFSGYVITTGGGAATFSTISFTNDTANSQITATLA